MHSDPFPRCLLVQLLHDGDDLSLPGQRGCISQVQLYPHSPGVPQVCGCGIHTGGEDVEGRAGGDDVAGGVADGAAQQGGVVEAVAVDGAGIWKGG